MPMIMLMYLNCDRVLTAIRCIPVKSFLVSSVPMHNVHKMMRNRTMSMEDYDKPMRERNNSLCGTPPAYPDNREMLSPPTPTLSSPSNDIPMDRPLIEGK